MFRIHIHRIRIWFRIRNTGRYRYFFYLTDLTITILVLTGLAPWTRCVVVVGAGGVETTAAPSAQLSAAAWSHTGKYTQTPPSDGQNDIIVCYFSQNNVVQCVHCGRRHLGNGYPVPCNYEKLALLVVLNAYQSLHTPK